MIRAQNIGGDLMVEQRFKDKQLTTKCTYFGRGEQIIYLHEHEGEFDQKVADSVYESAGAVAYNNPVSF